MTEKVTRTGKPHTATAADRAELRKKQNGKCLICIERPATDLDHNWATGAVRAYLCHGCNVLLGHRKENVSLLRALAVKAAADPRVFARNPLVATRYARAAKYLEIFGADPRRVVA